MEEGGRVEGTVGRERRGERGGWIVNYMSQIFNIVKYLVVFTRFCDFASDK